MECASLRYGRAMDSGGPFSLSHSLERRLRPKNVSDGAVASQLPGRRPPVHALHPRGRRSRQAGLPDLHTHRFRHTFAHQWLAQAGRDRPDAPGRL
jgi:hypothetical protein